MKPFQRTGPLDSADKLKLFPFRREEAVLGVSGGYGAVSKGEGNMDTQSKRLLKGEGPLSIFLAAYGHIKGNQDGFETPISGKEKGMFTSPRLFDCVLGLTLLPFGLEEKPLLVEGECASLGAKVVFRSVLMRNGAQTDFLDE